MKYITMEEALKLGVIPKEYDFLPLICKKEIGGCGAPIITTLDLTEQKCSNPRCKLKQAGRAIEMLNNFGIDGVGKVSMEKYFANPQNSSILMLWLAPEKTLNSYFGPSLSYKLRKEMDLVLAKEFTFAEVISNLALPGLASKALEVFEIMPSYTVFRIYLNQNNYDYDDYLLKFPGIGLTKAKELCEMMHTFEAELQFVEKIFNLVEPPKAKYTYTITGETKYHHMSKDMYVKHITRLAGPHVQAQYTPNSPGTCNYIVCATKYDKWGGMEYDDYIHSDNPYYADPMFAKQSADINEYSEDNKIYEWTSKHLKGILRTRSEGYDVLVTPDEFKEIIKEAARRWSD